MYVYYMCIWPFPVQLTQTLFTKTKPEATIGFQTSESRCNKNNTLKLLPALPRSFTLNMGQSISFWLKQSQ